ncbi:MAG TPA: glycosyltransferase family 1 protein, partial [Anaerolineae bacterium]|nr:glycosyltransferase family 1 protein [Anaerolineae bacterium]
PVRYVVHVGTIEPRKNLVRLVNAIQQVRGSLPEIGLVIVGKKGWLYGEFYELVAGLPAEAVISLGYVSDEDLPAVYGGAALCAVPSLYEGFGLPVLEAMACGTPVVCSHTSSLPEVGGDAPAYFDPEDTDAMAEVMRRALEDRQLQREMSEKGLAQAASFSWERAAQETMKVYDRVQSVT